MFNIQESFYGFGYIFKKLKFKHNKVITNDENLF